MTTDPQAYAAAQAAKGPVRRFVEKCQSFVANALTGTNSGYADANAGFAALSKQQQFYTQYVPPINTAVYWTGGDHGHVALSAGNGEAWTNDLRGPGVISKEKISDINVWLGSRFQYRGFGEQYANSGQTIKQRAGRMPGGDNSMSDVDIYIAARQAGFNKGQARTMTAIAIAESSGDPRSTADTRGRTNLPAGTHPEYSLGLWQINVLANGDILNGADPTSLYDPVTNAKAAKAIYDRQGFNAWSTYKNRTIWGK